MEERENVTHFLITPVHGAVAAHPQVVGAVYRFPNLLWSLLASEGHTYNTLDNRKKLRRDRAKTSANFEGVNMTI
jgi:hypothetical protein